MMRRNRRNEEGFFTIWVLGLCVVIFFIGGIALNLWTSFTDRRELAEIADAASISGASRIDLDCFKKKTEDGETGTTLVLEQGQTICPTQPLDVGTSSDQTALERANAYIDFAMEDKSWALTNRTVFVNDDGDLEVRLSRESDTTLTRLLEPTESFTVTVRSTASPRLAQ